MKDTREQSIGVVGAGITGLVTAYRLGQLGHRVTIYEASDRAGGQIGSFERDGYLLERGPHTLLVRNAETRTLIEQLGLEDAVLQANEEASKRFILRDGELVEVPTSPGAFLKTDLLSPAAKVRLLAEPFIGGPEPDIDESLAKFVERRLGEEVLEYAVGPFVGGTYAGDPRHLSARQSFPALTELESEGGSLFVGALGRMLEARKADKPRQPTSLISFKDGNQTLVDALVRHLDATVELEATVTALARTDDAWELTFEGEDQTTTHTHDAVLCCIPTYRLAALDIRDGDERADLDALADIVYPPVAIVAMGFDASAVEHPLDGFGVLVPEPEQRKILGSLFMSTLFEGRAPDGKVLLTSFVGGARQPELARQPRETIIDMVLEELRDLLGVARPPEMLEFVMWERSIPQYEVGYQRYLDHMDQLEEHHPGLYLAGNYRDGIAVPDLIAAAFSTAVRIDNDLAWQTA
ncbi:MAG: protoporphyrinogen oxidase [Myxococcota bacterium]